MASVLFCNLQSTTLPLTGNPTFTAVATDSYFPFPTPNRWSRSAQFIWWEGTRLFARERTAAHIQLLDRRFGRDVEVENVHRQPEGHACVGDLRGY